MRVLITGINGFVGRHLETELLVQGHQIFGIDVVSNKNSVFAVDITRKDDVQAAISSVSPDAIIHLAAIARVDFERPDLLYSINVNGTLNILSSLLYQKEKPKFLFVSSSLVYGRIDTSEPVTEDYKIRPINHYGASKVCGEALVMSFAEEYGIPSTIIRQFNQTGPGQSESFVIAKIVAAFKRKDKVIELGNINVYRDYLDVRDVVRVYALLLSDSPVCEVYNIASGEPVCIADVLSMLTEITGHQIEVRINQNFVRQNEIKSIFGSSSKLSAKYNWSKRIDFMHTLKDMLA